MLCKQSCYALLLLAALLLNSAAGATSAAPSATEQEQQDAFAKAYVAAKQSKNSEQLLKLLHPTVRACINDQNREFFNQILTGDMHNFPSSAPAKITTTPMASGSHPLIWNFFTPALFPYPILPTHTMQIDFQKDSDATSTLFSAVLELAPDHGSWFWVTACPTDKGMAFFHEKLQEGAQFKAKSRQLVSQIKEPLLSELKTLLANHDPSAAVKKYQAATGCDLSTASSVITTLQDPQQ